MEANVLKSTLNFKVKRVICLPAGSGRVGCGLYILDFGIGQELLNEK
jgi:hypothetical protein